MSSKLLANEAMIRFADLLERGIVNETSLYELEQYMQALWQALLQEKQPSDQLVAMYRQIRTEVLVRKKI